MNLMLIDLSSIAHPIWHMTQDDANPNKASEDIVARIRALASNHPHVAICCDKGKSFRHELTPTYKANRPEQEAPLHHQIRLARERLAGDGFPLWAVPGFEADDLIASACAKAAELPETDVLIVSADKDLLSLIGPTVKAKSLRDGSIVDEAAVVAKLGVKPSQVRDYLTLVGDASDNVKGAKGIGAKTAAKLLDNYGTLDSLYLNVSTPTVGEFTPGLLTALKDFQAEMPLSRQLITLRTDAEVPFDEILKERVIRDLAPLEEDPMPDDIDEAMPNLPATPTPQPPQAAAPKPAQASLEPPRVAVANGTPVQAPAPPQPTQSLAVQAPQPPDVLAPAPVEWEKQLEPRSIREVITLAKYVHESRLFSAYGTPQGILATLLAGRELGMQSMASLRAIHIIEGKPTMSADLMRALVLRSGAAKYFRVTERTAERSTWETQRGDDPTVKLTYTIDEARAAGVVKPNSGWSKFPADMLVARASSKLARLVYPDILHGIYTPEELEENR